MRILKGIKIFFASYMLVLGTFPGMLLMLTGTSMKHTAEICLAFDIFLWVIVLALDLFKICKNDGNCYFCRNVGDGPCEGTPGGN